MSLYGWSIIYGCKSKLVIWWIQLVFTFSALFDEHSFILCLILLATFPPLWLAHYNNNTFSFVNWNRSYRQKNWLSRLINSQVTEPWGSVSHIINPTIGHDPDFSHIYTYWYSMCLSSVFSDNHHKINYLHWNWTKHIVHMWTFIISGVITSGLWAETCK